MSFERKPLGSTSFQWVDESAAHQLGAIFVHGWRGHFEKTWMWKQPLYMRVQPWAHRKPALDLLELLKDGFPYCDFLSFGHPGGTYDHTTIDLIARALNTFIDNYAASKKIILIGHSLGGLACRQALLQRLDEHGADELPIVGIMTLATPNNGAEFARLARFSQSARDLEPFSKQLHQLNLNWVRRITNGGDPDEDINRRAFVLFKAVVGLRDRVVSPQSASTLACMGEVAAIGKTHASIARASDSKDETFVEVVRFLETCQNEIPRIALNRAALSVSDSMRRQVVGGEWIRREQEDVTFSDDADADGVYRVAVCCRRTGIACTKVLSICFALDGYGPPEDEVPAYTVLLGRGLMAESEQADLSGRFLMGDAARVVGAKLHVGGSQYEYSQVRDVRQGGFRRVTLECSSGDVCDGRYRNDAEIVLQVEYPLHRNQNWYRYFSKRTALEGIDITVKTPMKVTLTSAIAHSRIAEREHNVALGGGFMHHFAVRGPVVPGEWVQWSFLDA